MVRGRRAWEGTMKMKVTKRGTSKAHMEEGFSKLEIAHCLSAKESSSTDSGWKVSICQGHWWPWGDDFLDRIGTETR